MGREEAYDTGAGEGGAVPRGKTIRRRRMAAGVRQQDLAAAISLRTGWRITQPRLSDIEGEAFPMPRGFSLVAIACIADIASGVPARGMGDK